MRRKALLDKIEQVVRLIRSKGVGVYFVTQNPLDVPDTVLGQLGNRVQHALRAFTPRDQKAVKTAAETIRAESEARYRESDHRARRRRSAGLVARRERAAQRRRARLHRAAGVAHRPDHRRGAAHGHRGIVDRTDIYEKTVDRESAYEKLKGRAAQSTASAGAGSATTVDAPAQPGGGMLDSITGSLGGLMKGTGRKDSLVEAVAKSAARSVGSSVGRAIVRGVLGSLLGGSRSR